LIISFTGVLGSLSANDNYLLEKLIFKIIKDIHIYLPLYHYNASLQPSTLRTEMNGILNHLSHFQPPLGKITINNDKRMTETHQNF